MQKNFYDKIKISFESIFKEYTIELNKQNLTIMNDTLVLTDEKSSIDDRNGQNSLTSHNITQNKKEVEKVKSRKNSVKKLDVIYSKKKNSESKRFDLSQNDLNESVKIRTSVNYDKIFDELIENSNKVDESDSKNKHVNKTNDIKLKDQYLSLIHI